MARDIRPFAESLLVAPVFLVKVGHLLPRYSDSLQRYKIIDVNSHVQGAKQYFLLEASTIWKNIKSLLTDNVHPYDVSMRIYSKGICAAFGSIKRRYNKFELECYVDIIYVSSSCAVTICSYRSSINLVILVVRFMLIITQNISQFWLQSVMTMSWSYCYNYTRFHGLTVNLVTVCIYIYIHDTFIMHMLEKI